ncbi:hypothetical protein [Shewanella aestuarii]|uniref:Uncharacterized protein n=1 Tax=Shewanella aestuarii TaxID=1028752 RepID=A0A6G9QGH3_9GAMM|nr:hypothetical protein [Shewanella aestuarii]QIR13572.1 hypothetical protein HBH39_02820 [Shewanella aestuarii]
MKFVTELPQDVLAILKREYPEKSYQAAIKLFIRQYNPTNEVKDDQANHNTKQSSM